MPMSHPSGVEPDLLSRNYLLGLPHCQLRAIHLSLGTHTVHQESYGTGGSGVLRDEHFTLLFQVCKVVVYSSEFKYSKRHHTRHRS